MAAAVTLRKRGTLGKNRTVAGTLTFDSSYPTNGEALTAGTVGLKTIDKIDFEVPATGTYTVAYDYTAAKAKVFTAADAVEVTNTTSLAALVVKFLAVGI